MRIIYEFGKNGRLRYISHLDLQRFMMRALRRTDLPAAYSQGFNPHPLLSFASALAMGWSSDVELMDLKLTNEVAAGSALEQMRNALPPDLPVHRCRLVSDHHPALMSRLCMADYLITLKGKDTPSIITSIDDYIHETTITAIRKTKTAEREINIRPLTIQLNADGDDMIRARLMLTPENTLKPDVLLSALADRSGASLFDFSIRRTALLGQNSNGEIVPLMELQS